MLSVTFVVSTHCVQSQVGAQDVALGVKFKAACKLNICEHVEGVPDNLCTAGTNGFDQFFPYPSDTLTGRPVRDISFALLDGDFKVRLGCPLVMNPYGNKPTSSSPEKHISSLRAHCCYTF